MVWVAVAAVGCGGRKAAELGEKNKGFAENLKKAIAKKNKAEVEQIGRTIDAQQTALKRFTPHEYDSIKAVLDAVKAEDWKDAERLADLCLGDQAKRGGKKASKPGGI